MISELFWTQATNRNVQLIMRQPGRHVSAALIG